MSSKQQPTNLPHYTVDLKAPSDGPGPSPNRGFRTRLVFSFLVTTCILFSLALRVTPLRKATLHVSGVADDPRLEAYRRVDDAQECAEWTTTNRGLSSVSFNLLQGADLLFVLSSGVVTGKFDMDRRTNYSYPGASPYITVEVTTHSLQSQPRPRVCRMGHEGRNERGILIHGEPGQAPMNVNVTVVIPLHLRVHKDITIDLPAFVHDITGSFDDWWTKGLEANPPSFKPAMEQSGDNLRGIILHVETSNAFIVVDARMSGLGAGSDITLDSSNGTIEGVFGVANGMVKTTLKARVHTSHAAVRILADPFESLYINSSLTLDVTTSEAPISVYLPPSYEGAYNLQTTEGNAEVEEDKNVEDPSGMDRRRTLQNTVSDVNRVQGYMYWSHNGDPSEEGMDRGSVSIRNTRSDITMYC
ncbi:hypothetical protein C8R47DRAFT_1215756 [Mycena vitilis]|nr:hypothetical protein C8R47DRAFT_1215756 [Mycena vitilis]